MGPSSMGFVTLLYALLPIIIFTSLISGAYRNGQKNIDKNDRMRLSAFVCMFVLPIMIIVAHCIFVEGYFDFAIRYGFFDTIQVVRYALIGVICIGSLALFFRKQFLNIKIVELGIIAVISVCAIAFYVLIGFNDSLNHIRENYIFASLSSFIFVVFLGQFLGYELYNIVKNQ